LRDGTCKRGRAPTAKFRVRLRHRLYRDMIRERRPSVCGASFSERCDGATAGERATLHTANVHFVLHRCRQNSAVCKTLTFIMALYDATSVARRNCGCYLLATVQTLSIAHFQACRKTNGSTLLCAVRANAAGDYRCSSVPACISSLHYRQTYRIADAGVLPFYLAAAYLSRTVRRYALVLRLYGAALCNRAARQRWCCRTPTC